MLGMSHENILHAGRCLILASALACLPSCLGEDRSNCPDETQVEATPMSRLHVHIMLPDDQWNDYESRNENQLPCTLELYDRTTNSCRWHCDTMAVAEKYGGFALDFEIEQGHYELLAWTQGQNREILYDTSDLRMVKMLPQALDGTHPWEERLAYSAGMKVEASDEDCYIDVNLVRPFAIYRLFVIDGEEYINLAQDHDWPPIDRIAARVLYNGFYPTGMNVSTGYANDAMAGVSYDIQLEYDDINYILVGEDAVLAHGDDTFLMASLVIYDKVTHETVTTSSGIKIPYRQGCITTISGSWLCSSDSQGGVGIDTKWNEIIVPF